MNLNDIKKALYREKPIATIIDDGVTGTRGSSAITIVTYKAKLSFCTVEFCVPTHEMGIERFKNEEPAHLLIRWIEQDRIIIN